MNFLKWIFMDQEERMHLKAIKKMNYDQELARLFALSGKLQARNMLPEVAKYDDEQRLNAKARIYYNRY